MVVPMVAGLDVENDYKPYISEYDYIGTLSDSTPWQAAGSAGEFLFGTCEALYKEGMESTQLFETTAQALIAGVNRDAYSGWGGIVYTMFISKIGRLVK